MLQITIPEREYFDEVAQSFIQIKSQTLQLEHSLVSLSKWESKWNKPFLSRGEKTIEETVDYIRCMTITQNVNPNVYLGITDSIVEQVMAYIDLPMTATTFNEENTGRKSQEIITAEVIYYWMISLNIPFECQKWHLNRLLTQIRVCNIKSSPPKKMGRKELMARNRALKASRRKALNTKG